MEEITSTNAKVLAPKLFNSDLEAGLRAVIILNAFLPRSLDLNDMALYDYFVVHTHDVGGPESVHPEISSRSGEYIVRRRVIEGGLKLMHRVHLVKIKSSNVGVTFESADEASALLDLMCTPYNEKLKKCARWLAQQSNDSPSGSFENHLRSKIGRWELQFNSSNDVFSGDL